MKVSELIEKLSALRPDTDVVVDGPGAYVSSQLQSKALRFVDGYMVCGPEGMTTGYFVSKQRALMVEMDGKQFLDLRSRFITPALFISYDKYAKEEPPPPKRKKNK